MDVKDLTGSKKGNGNPQPNTVSLFQREINRMFDNFFPGLDLVPDFYKGTTGGLWDPNLDVSETEKEILVTAELPGVEEKDIELSIAENTLTIKGEKKKESEETKKDYYRKEISYGSFRQVLSLPAEVDQSKVDAKFSKGVLKVTLPKSVKAQSETKKIPIKAG